MKEISVPDDAINQAFVGEAYHEALKARYGDAPEVDTAIYGWKTTASMYETDRDILYLRLGSGKPLYYVPGFTENITGKIPTVFELADRGFEVITANVNRFGTDESKEATRSQALDHLAVIKAEGLTDSPMDLGGHSYGALVVDEMVKIANEWGWKCFEGTQVVLAAPSGVKDGKEHYLSFGGRFARHFVSEIRSHKDFADPGGEMIKATLKTMAANKARTIHEVTDEIMKDKVDFARMRANGIGSISVIGFGNDKLYPHKVLGPGVAQAWEADPSITYVVPYSLEQQADGRLLGRTGATHNDDSFNPSRVAGTIAQLLS